MAELNRRHNLHPQIFETGQVYLDLTNVEFIVGFR